MRSASTQRTRKILGYHVWHYSSRYDTGSSLRWTTCLAYIMALGILSEHSHRWSSIGYFGGIPRGQIRRHTKLHDATGTDRLARKRHLCSLGGLRSHSFVLGGEQIPMVIVSCYCSSCHGLWRWRPLHILRGRRILY